MTANFGNFGQQRRVARGSVSPDPGGLWQHKFGTRYLWEHWSSGSKTVARPSAAGHRRHASWPSNAARTPLGYRSLQDGLRDPMSNISGRTGRIRRCTLTMPTHPTYYPPSYRWSPSGSINAHHAAKVVKGRRNSSQGRCAHRLLLLKVRGRHLNNNVPRYGTVHRHDPAQQQRNHRHGKIAVYSPVTDLPGQSAKPTAVIRVPVSIGTPSAHRAKVAARNLVVASSILRPSSRPHDGNHQRSRAMMSDPREFYAIRCQKPWPERSAASNQRNRDPHHQPPGRMSSVAARTQLLRAGAVAGSLCSPQVMEKLTASTITTVASISTWTNSPSLTAFGWSWICTSVMVAERSQHHPIARSVTCPGG
jgi:hypothetical protein